MHDFPFLSLKMHIKPLHSCVVFAASGGVEYGVGGAGAPGQAEGQCAVVRDRQQHTQRGEHDRSSSLRRSQATTGARHQPIQTCPDHRRRDCVSHVSQGFLHTGKHPNTFCLKNNFTTNCHANWHSSTYKVSDIAHPPYKNHDLSIII